MRPAKFIPLASKTPSQPDLIEWLAAAMRASLDLKEEEELIEYLAINEEELERSYDLIAILLRFYRSRSATQDEFNELVNDWLPCLQRLLERAEEKGLEYAGTS